MQCCPTAIGGHLLLFVGVIILFCVVSCSPDSNLKKESEFHGRKTISQVDNERWLDPCPSSDLLWARDSMKRDSTLKAFHFSPVMIKPDREGEERMLQESTNIVPLWAVYFYFESGDIFTFINGIDASDLVEKIRQYFGFRRNVMATWDSSMKKMVHVFSKTLSKEGKLAVSKSLIFHAQLIDSLDCLSDHDLLCVMQVLDTIVRKQTVHHSWLWTAEAEHTLCVEYVLLRRVWTMPVLIRGGRNGEYGEDSNEEGHYLFLGRYLKDLRNDEDYELLWNTRYWNKYQYAIGVVHRRIKDIGVMKAENMRKVIKKTASVMKDAGELLKQ